MAQNKPARAWRVVDIITASVLAVATGIIFVVWNSLGGAWFSAIDALTPGLGGLVAGIWLLGGVLGGLVIRKPGAAIYVELLAAVVSTGLGSQWGPETLLSGIVQGLGAELVFALFAYARFTLPVAVLAGVGASVGAWVLELVTSANLAKGILFNAIYLGTLSLSGALLAGALSWYLVRALARTGALDRFAAGREA